MISVILVIFLVKIVESFINSWNQFHNTSVNGRRYCQIAWVILLVSPSKWDMLTKCFFLVGSLIKELNMLIYSLKCIHDITHKELLLLKFESLPFYLTHKEWNCWSNLYNYADSKSPVACLFVPQHVQAIKTENFTDGLELFKYVC